MADKLTVLQIGTNNWSEDNEINEFLNSNFDWTYLTSKDWQNDSELLLDELITAHRGTFDLMIYTDPIDSEQSEMFQDYIDPYRLIVDSVFRGQPWLNEISELKLPFFLDFKKKKEVLTTLQKNFFSNQWGSKLHTNQILVNDQFDGQSIFEGVSYWHFNGDYSQLNGADLFNWQMNMYIHENYDRDLWLEYYRDESVRISLKIVKIAKFSGQILDVLTFNEEEINNGITIENDGKVGYLTASIIAEGSGELKVGPLHHRESRNGFGDFFPGGHRIHDQHNQELLYYYNPGDLKPPLNVYFSGFRTAEGFEGFYMMRNLGAPYLLIGDPRLEGGSFYLGSEELEEGIAQVIKEHLNRLGFNNNQLILSGLSMGSMGSMYYATKLNPRFVINGKPLTSLGDIARGAKTSRPAPDDWGGSLDMVKLIEGSLSEESLDKANQRFWDVFNHSSFEQTDFISSYMKNDDYDLNAYPMLVDSLSKTNSTIIGKGILGRHNDNSAAINQWFITQYQRVLSEEFSRNFE